MANTIPNRVDGVDQANAADINHLLLGLAEWRTDRTYDLDRFVSHLGIIYKSLSASNTGNTPASSPGSWSVFSPGGSGTTYLYVSANYPVPDSATGSLVLIVDASGGAIAITLPAVNPSNQTRRIRIYKSDSSTNKVNIQSSVGIGSSSVLIRKLFGPKDCLEVESDTGTVGQWLMPIYLINPIAYTPTLGGAFTDGGPAVGVVIVKTRFQVMGKRCRLVLRWTATALGGVGNIHYSFTLPTDFPHGAAGFTAANLLGNMADLGANANYVATEATSTVAYGFGAFKPTTAFGVFYEYEIA